VRRKKMAIIRQSDPKKWTHVDDHEYEVYCKDKGIDPEKYTTMELLAIAAARQTYDFSFIFAGTGLPMIGCMMAQHTYAPNSLIIMEAGILDPKLLDQLAYQPMGDPVTASRTIME